MITIERYGTRNWAVYFDGELLAVTLYKRGALTIQSTFEVLRRHFGYLPKVAASRPVLIGKVCNRASVAA